MATLLRLFKTGRIHQRFVHQGFVFNSSSFPYVSSILTTGIEGVSRGCTFTSQMCQQGIFAVKVCCVPGCISLQVQWSGPSPLFHTYVNTSRLLHIVWSSPLQNRHQHTRERASPAKSIAPVRGLKHKKPRGDWRSWVCSSLRTEGIRGILLLSTVIYWETIEKTDSSGRYTVIR